MLTVLTACCDGAVDRLVRCNAVVATYPPAATLSVQAERAVRSSSGGEPGRRAEKHTVNAFVLLIRKWPRGVTPRVDPRECTRDPYGHPSTPPRTRSMGLPHARSGTFMILLRNGKNIFAESGFVKKSARLRSVRTYGTRILWSSTASRMKK